MGNFSLLIKPVSSACNLNCRYCYYHNPAKAPEAKGSPPARMNERTLRRMIRTYMASDQDVYAFIWHGGEPSIMPLAFYEKAVAYQKQYAPPGARISNTFQTNGVQIPENLARFMARYRFLCGVSLDGPAHIHDQYRKTLHHGPSHALVIKGIKTLSGAGVALNALTLVSRANVHYPLKTYRYLKSLGFEYLHFIPCAETAPDGTAAPFAINGDEWGQFLIDIFNAWIKNDVHTISIRLFESILAKIVYNTAIDCQNSRSCNRYLVVEANGDVFPCDFFAAPAFKLGNIFQTNLETIALSDQFSLFSQGKTRWHPKCNNCEFLRFCMGDCRKFRCKKNQQDAHLSLLCRGWKKFYTATLDQFHLLSQSVRAS